MKFEYQSDDFKSSDSATNSSRRDVGKGYVPKKSHPLIKVLMTFLILGLGFLGVIVFLALRQPSNEETVIPETITECQKPNQAENVNLSKVCEYLTPTVAEINQLYNYVLESPFVRKNPAYYKRLKDLPFIYSATNDVVNAAAGRYLVEKDGKKEIAFNTVFYGGAARYARLVGLAFALQESGQKDALQGLFARMPARLCAICSEKDVLSIIDGTPLVGALADATMRQRATSFSSGTIAYIISHEMGHHALGHMTGFYEKENLEISRNQEREADSFASSVISSSSFGEYIFAGTLFWSYALAIQSDGDSDIKNTHPLWRERFENLVRANSEKAAALGIALK